MKETFISVDVEAAGPIPGAYSMLSIGACVVGSTSLNFYIELKPINDASIIEALEITGHKLDYFESKGVSSDRAMKQFEKWIVTVSKNTSPVFVGFNAPFDWSFINWYFHIFLGKNPFGIGGIDIKAYYMGMAGCSWSDTRSSRISDQFKGKSPHTHNALDDAIEQAEMFELMRNNSNRVGS